MMTGTHLLRELAVAKKIDPGNEENFQEGFREGYREGFRGGFIEGVMEHSRKKTDPLAYTRVTTALLGGDLLVREIERVLEENQSLPKKEPPTGPVEPA